jgi:hypothetical protein
MDGFDIVLEGPLAVGEEDAVMGAFEAAGATWWIHSDWEGSGSGALRRRIEAGPPRQSAS